MSSSRIRLFLLLAPLAICPVFIAGCGPSVSRDELGTVVFDAKELPGAGKPYDHPEMHVPGSKSPAKAAPSEPTPAESAPAVDPVPAATAPAEAASSSPGQPRD